MIIYTLKGKKENVKSQIEGRKGGGGGGFLVWCCGNFYFKARYCGFAESKQCAVSLNLMSW